MHDLSFKKFEIIFFVITWDAHALTVSTVLNLARCLCAALKNLDPDFAFKIMFLLFINIRYIYVSKQLLTLTRGDV